MKVAVRGLARERVVPLVWAHGLDIAGDGPPAVLLCDGDDAGRVDDPPRVECTTTAFTGRVAAAAQVRWPSRAALPPAPEPAADAPLAEVLAALRAQYVHDLPRALAELARALIDARSGAAPLDDACMLAHRLRGTAGSYGQPQVGEAAGRLEQLLVAEELAPPVLAGLLDAMAGPVLAAAGAAAGAPRLLVVGSPPPGLAGGVRLADLAAAARAVAAGEGDALWYAGGDLDTTEWAHAPVFRDIPVALVRTSAGAVAAAALACLWPGPWARLFAPVG